MRIIGYSYEADFHCVGCTFERFNTLLPPTARLFGMVDFISEPEVEDSEGNAIHPIFSFDLEQEENCGDCRGPLNY